MSGFGGDLCPYSASCGQHQPTVSAPILLALAAKEAREQQKEEEHASAVDRLEQQRQTIIDESRKPSNEYRCMAIKKYAFNHLRGERCRVTTGLDERGLCDSHEGRDAKWTMPGPPPPFRPPPSEGERAAEFAKKEVRKSKRAAAADGVRERIRSLVSDDCDAACDSSLFTALASHLLKAPSKVRVRALPPIAAALERAWKAISAAGLTVASPPLPAVDPASAPSDVVYDAIFRAPIVARVRAAADKSWWAYFSSRCAAAMPADTPIHRYVNWDVFYASVKPAITSFLKHYPAFDATEVPDHYPRALDEAELLAALQRPGADTDAAAAASAEAQARYSEIVDAAVTAGVTRYVAAHAIADEYISFNWPGAEKAEWEADPLLMRHVHKVTAGKDGLDVLERRDFRSCTSGTTTTRLTTRAEQLGRVAVNSSFLHCAELH